MNATFLLVNTIKILGMLLNVVHREAHKLNMIRKGPLPVGVG